ncbi:MAG: hypothetical protein A2W31_13890 [Planctomycetes bacterium RBG_16_64_10]|nr:MAG: hypothetical protein A2W31_13890 [Planctomycetes bacterium RBG_16_64_10]
MQFPTAGQHTLTAALDPDPVAADNARSTVLDLPEAIPVLLIDPSREGRDAYYLAAALAPGGAVSTGLRPRIEAPSFLRNHAQLNEFAAIYLLNLDRLDRAEIEAVEDYVRAGGGVAFFLGERCNARFFNAELHRDGDGMFPVPLTFPTDLLVDRLDTAADLVVTDHPIFALLRGARNSFLGSVVVERYFAVPTGWAPDPRAATRVIARLRNGAPLVVEQRFGDGRVVAVLTKLAPEDSPQGRWNNWARNNPSFVVTMLELQGYLGRQRDGGRERLVGQPLVVTLDPQQHERTVRFKPPTDQNAAAILVDAEPAGDALQAVLPSTGRSGIYEAQVRGRDGTLARRLFAYNVVAREGDLQMVGQTELAAKLSGVPHSFLHAADTQRDAAALAGVNLSRVVLALLIVLLLIEQLVAHAASYHVLPGGPSR